MTVPVPLSRFARLKSYAALRPTLLLFVEAAQHRIRRTSRAALAAVLLVTGLPAAKGASSTFWTNTSIGDWFIDNNWDTGLPEANTSTFIRNGGTAFINAPGATAEDVFVGEYTPYPSAGGNGTLLISTGSSGVPGSLTAKSVSCAWSTGNPPQVISGTLNISNGASVTATGLRRESNYGIAIGDGTGGGHGGVGSVNISGAGSLLNSKVGLIAIGQGDATGTLVVENGARAQSAGGNIHIGSVTVKGAGSVWDSSKTLSLGSGGDNCSLLITTGGLVKALALQLSNGFVTVNNGSTTVPGLTITGPESASSFAAAGVLIIGDTTAGRMEVRSGAGVATFRGFVGFSANGVGSALVQGNWKATGSIWIGDSGNGTLEVLSGGVVSSDGNGYLAFANNSAGVATVSGTGSSWTMKNGLYIGGNSAGPGGSGQLRIFDGGTVGAGTITLWNTGILSLGANATLNGPLTVEGGAIETGDNITFAKGFTIGAGGVFVRTYGFNPTFSGVISGLGGLSKSGTFTGSGLGTLTLTGANTYTGPTSIGFGKLVVNGSITSAVTVNGNGTLGGTGTVNGITIKSGGVLAPGNSAGKLTVQGNYTQESGGILNVELGGTTPGTGFDQVAVGGSASISGTLNLNLVNGFRPVVGQTFAIITSGSATGNFSAINSSGFTVRSDVTNAGVVLTVTDVVPGIPVITSPTSAAGTQDQPFNYQITATESPTSFGATALPPGLSANTATGVISGTPTAVGSFDVTISATNSTGPGSATLTITISAPPPSSAPSLANISTRLPVETGDNALIGGFIVTGTQSKKVIVRAIGPSLPFADKLQDPTLELHGANGLVDSNDNWIDSPNKQAIIDSTIPPGNDLESAIVATLPANNSAYTAVVRGANSTTGIGVVEIYDLDRSVDSKLANISTRGLVQTGDNVLIAGTIVLGQTSQKVIIRAIGPSLPIAGKLADPTLELRNANGDLIRANDNWRTGGQEAEIIASTVPPTNDLEAAIVATLPAGGASYTAIVRGVNDSIGIAVIEVYALE